MSRKLVGGIQNREPAVGAGGKINKKEVKPALAAEEALAEKLSRPVSSLKLKGFYFRAARACLSQLEKSGVKTLGDLVRKSEEDLLQVRYARGEKFRKVLTKELAGLGLKLGMGEELDKRQLIQNLATRVDECKFSVRVRVALSNMGVTHLFEVVQKREEELLKGTNRDYRYATFTRINKELNPLGLCIGMTLDDKTLAEVKRLIPDYKAPEKDGMQAEAARIAANAKSLRDLGLSPEKIAKEAHRLVAAGQPNEEIPEERYVRFKQATVLETNLGIREFKARVRAAGDELETLLQTVRPEATKAIRALLDLFGKREQKPESMAPSSGGGRISACNPAES